MKKLIHLCLLGIFIILAGSVSVEAKETGTRIYINPLYRDVVTKNDIKIPEEKNGGGSISGNSVYYTTVENAGRALKTGLLERKESITVKYRTKKMSQPLNLANDILNNALQHTGNPKEGDYLRWGYAGCGIRYVSYCPDGVNCDYTITYALMYNSNAEQEKAVDAEVANILRSLNLGEKNEYQKIRAIYDYICKNVKYDYDNLENREYLLKHSAYAAIINKKAVCQGYALLLYRMLEEAGIDGRIIIGTGNGGSHAWNIVRLDGVYYNVDSTWDAPMYKYRYRYFLKNTADFDDHTRNSEYETEEFHRNYVMSAKNYFCASAEGHRWNAGEVSQEATCVKNGVRTYICTVCQETRTEAIVAPGHKEVIDQAVAPTCTEDGKSEGSHCKECGVVLRKQQVISKTGHSYSGEKCTRCGDIRTLPAPTVNSLTNVSSGITIKWGKVSGAQKYRVYRKSGNSGYKKLVDTKSTSYTDKKVGKGVKYTYAVRCITSAGKDASGMRDGTSLVRFSNPALSSVSNTKGKQMLIKWKKYASISGYEIEYATNKKFTSGKKSVNIGSNSAVTQRVTNLTKNKTYYVRIRVYKIIDDVKYTSGWSSIKSVKIKK